MSFSKHSFSDYSKNYRYQIKIFRTGFILGGLPERMSEVFIEECTNSCMGLFMNPLEKLSIKHFALISPEITSLDYSFIIPRNIETNYASYVLENRSDIFQDYNALGSIFIIKIYQWICLKQLPKTNPQNSIKIFQNITYNLHKNIQYKCYDCND